MESDPPPEEPVSYAEWGAEFFREAINERRVLAGIGALTGQPIEVGPMGMGPGGIARVSATGVIGEPPIERIGTDPVSFRAVLPVRLDFTVEMPVGTHHFHATLGVPLRLTARGLRGVRIRIDIDPPHARDIETTVRADGLPASLVQRFGNVETELRRFVAGYVAREVRKPRVADSLVIDVAATMDDAWSAPAERARVTDDLQAQLEQELESSGPSLFGEDPS